MSHDLLIHGGDVVSSSGVERADVWIEGGRVRSVGADLQVPAEVPRLDATNKWVFPGLMDPQVHFREPGGEAKEDLASGSEAALAGGVTAYCEMPNTNPATATPELFADKLERARGRSRADYAFFLGATEENADLIGEWETLPGCSGIKVFMGASTGSLLIPDDPTLERVLRSGKRRVTVHSEDDPRLKERYADLMERYPDGAPVGLHHQVRDIESAVRSTKRLLDLAEKTGRRIHLLHVSTAEELDIVRERDLGDLVTVEATPNHLFLAAPECYEEHGTWAQMNPPVREARHRDALREALLDGTVTCIGSDHAPHMAEEKARPFPKSPSGIPGVQTTIALLLTAVRDGWLRREDMVRLQVEGPARVYGILDRGPLVPGSVGTAVVVDPSRTETLAAEWLLSRSPCNPFIGRPLAGLPTEVVLRGQVVLRDGVRVSDPAGQPLEVAETVRP